MEPLTIDGQTKITGLIGEDVTHSLSPRMHTASYAKNGINAVYVSLSMPLENVEPALRGMVAMGFSGCNVTMPYKAVVLPLLDDATPVAKLMGAVNTIEFTDDGRMIGHNTDGAGFMRNLAQHGIAYEGKTMTITGAGGAGSAIITQAAHDGVAKIDVFNIKDQIFDALGDKLQRIQDNTKATIVLHDLANRDELRECVAASDLFVNATRVGMTPMDDQCTIDEDMLHPGLAVADTVYIPRGTKLVRMAREHGLPCVEGLGMLLEQGSIAEYIWFGKYMDIPYIEKEFFSE